MNDQHRAAARGSGEGVLGSKMCKIIAVTGTKKIPALSPAYTTPDSSLEWSDQGPHTGKADVESMAYTELENASGLCQMANFYGGLLTGVELWEAMTGWKLDLNDFGRHSFLMRMAINVREGLRKSDYTASPRLVGKPPFESGPLAGVTIDNEKLGGMDDVAEAIGV